MILAAAAGRSEIARLLLGHGAQVDMTDRDGRTPLMLAVMRDNRALVEILLAHSAATGKADAYGKTAPAYAREEGYSDLAALLTR